MNLFGKIYISVKMSPPLINTNMTADHDRSYLNYEYEYCNNPKTAQNNFCYVGIIASSKDHTTPRMITIRAVLGNVES